MLEEPSNQERTEPEIPRPVPRDTFLRKMVAAPVVAVALVGVLVMAIGAGIGYLVGQNGSTRAQGPPTQGPHSVFASPSAPRTASASSPSSAGIGIPVIPMSAACKWAYPGQASGKISGSAYSIVCLGQSGQVLGGFSGSHSLNAWCADPSHTDGRNMPAPALVNGVWMCSSPTGQPAPASSAGQGPSGSPAAVASSPPAVASSPAVIASSPAVAGGPAPVSIPMSAACKWAYPGQASGKISGSAYSIVCLGQSGQVLGGFSGSHSLNAWCADPSHTDGRDLPSPALVNGIWICTR